MSQNKQRQEGTVPAFRDRIAIIVIIFSVLFLMVVASVSLWTSDQKSKTAQLIFNALLPLLGTWVGAVLAFYFSKENYQAAAQFAKDTLATTIEKKLQPIPVNEVMIQAHRITAHILAEGEKLDDVKLIGLRDAMLKAGFKRMLILNQGKQFQAIVHHEPLAAFLLDAMADEGIKQALKDQRNKEKLEDLTLGDAQAVQGTLIRSLKDLAAFVPQTASLAEAKNRMESVQGCQDVFVTSTGARNEAVLGWITNNEIMDRLRS